MEVAEYAPSPKADKLLDKLDDNTMEVAGCAAVPPKANELLDKLDLIELFVVLGVDIAVRKSGSAK